MCFSQAAQSSNPYQAARGLSLAGALLGRGMGNAQASAYVQKFKQDFRNQHNGMTAAQVGPRGQS